MDGEEKISKQIHFINTEKLVKSPLNPREYLGEIEELTDTVIESGIVEPLIVRPRKDGKYEVLSGWRRAVAAIKAGLEKVPCRIADVDDNEALQIIALTDIQRQDLQPYERAILYKKMLDTYGISIDTLAARLGKSKGFLMSYLSILQLPEEIARDIKTKPSEHESPLTTLTVTKAEYLKGLPEHIQYKIYNYIKQKGILRDTLRKRVGIIKKYISEKGTITDNVLNSILEGTYEVEEKETVGGRPVHLVIENDIPTEHIKKVIIVIEYDGVVEEKEVKFRVVKQMPWKQKISELYQTVKKYQCPYCGREFNSREERDNHMDKCFTERFLNTVPVTGDAISSTTSASDSTLTVKIFTHPYYSSE